MDPSISPGLRLFFTPHTVLDMPLCFTPMVFLGQNPNPVKRLSLCQVYTPVVAMSHSPSRALRRVSLETVPSLQLEEHVLPKQTAGEFGQSVPGRDMRGRMMSRSIGGTLHLNGNEKAGSLHQCKESLKEPVFVKRARKTS